LIAEHVAEKGRLNAESMWLKKQGYLIAEHVAEKDRLKEAQAAEKGYLIAEHVAEKDRLKEAQAASYFREGAPAQESGPAAGTAPEP
jgi:hypothetical protein